MHKIKTAQEKHAHGLEKLQVIRLILRSSLSKVSQIAHVYTRRVDVINRGFSGYNSRWLLRMLPELFPYYLYRSHPPSLITCLVGSNDSTLPVSRQHVPLEEFKENIQKIVEYFKGMGRRRNEIPVILLTPPPLDERGWATYCGQTGKDMDRTFELTRLYSRAAKAVGEELSLPVIDLHEILKGEEGPEVFKVFFYDGLHFSGKGNTLVAEEIMRTINQSFPHLDMEKVPMEGPYWADIQPNQAHIPRYSTEI